LSMDVTLPGAQPFLVRCVPQNFEGVGSIRSYLLSGTFVICKGIVYGTIPAADDPDRDAKGLIARLPAETRPPQTLRFAALQRKAFEVGGHKTFSSQLVTLEITQDGWIRGESVRASDGGIDLSALRFCTSRGISLIDEVRVHTCQVAGTRLVCMQGHLSDRYFSRHSDKPLALLLDSCQPPKKIPFIVAGEWPGCFHLLVVRPSMGALGMRRHDVSWRDGYWDHDTIHFTGIMYEVATEAMVHATLDAQWSEESLKIFVADFQKLLVRRFGSIETAWREAFDVDGSGTVNFTEFGLGCKVAGFVGNATRIWAALDDDCSGEISLDEISMGMDDEPKVQLLPKLAGAARPADV